MSSVQAPELVCVRATGVGAAATRPAISAVERCSINRESVYHKQRKRRRRASTAATEQHRTSLPIFSFTILPAPLRPPVVVLLLVPCGCHIRAARHGTCHITPMCRMVQACDVLDTPWAVAYERARKAGVLLAEVLMSRAQVSPGQH